MDKLVALSLLPDRMLNARTRADYLALERADRVATSRSRRASMYAGLRGGMVNGQQVRAALPYGHDVRSTWRGDVDLYREVLRTARSEATRSKRTVRLERTRSRIELERALVPTVKMGAMD